VPAAGTCTMVAACRPRACRREHPPACAPQEASHLAEAHGAWRALAGGGQPGAADANGAANGAAAGPPPPGAAAGPGSALERLLATPTPARVLLSRVPPDAEAQLYFMLTQARARRVGSGLGGCDSCGLPRARAVMREGRPRACARLPEQPLAAACRPARASSARRAAASGAAVAAFGG